MYRVNWLRAKARYTRWQEEQVLLISEMQNTIRWFQHRGRTWEARSEAAMADNLKGHAAYARKQVFLSNRFLANARKTFLPLFGPPHVSP